MASDISILIEEQICNTLETSLSVICTVDNTYNISQDYIKDLNLVSIDGNIVCNDFSITSRFLLPTQLSNYIFNTMMMEEGDLLVDLTDDTADAIKEIVGQIGGSLATAINGSGFEDLSGCKFEVGDFSIVNGADYELLHKLVLLKLKINDSEDFDIILDFSEDSFPFLSRLSNSEVIEVEENISNDTEEDTEESKEESEEQATEDNQEKDEEEQPSEEIKKDEDSPDGEKESNTEEESSNDNSEEKGKEEETKKDEEDSEKEELTPEEKKEKKLKLFVYIVAGLLVLVIIAFGVLFYMGAFDEPKPVVKKVVKVKKHKNNNIIIDVKNKEINFKIDMINVKRLNRRLSFLTKYDILEDDALAKFKQKEKERLYKLKMKRLEEFASRNKEESLFKTKNNLQVKDTKRKNRFLIDEKHPMSEANKNILENEELVFIQIPSLKYKKYRDIINKEKTKSIQISICRNSINKVDVYIGPIYVKTIINNIIKSIKNKNDAKIIILTKKEFDKRCDF
jgi:hypothetical protein